MPIYAIFPRDQILGYSSENNFKEYVLIIYINEELTHFDTPQNLCFTTQSSFFTSFFLSEPPAVAMVLASAHQDVSWRVWSICGDCREPSLTDSWSTMGVYHNCKVCNDFFQIFIISLLKKLKAPPKCLAVKLHCFVVMFFQASYHSHGPGYVSWPMVDSSGCLANSREWSFLSEVCEGIRKQLDFVRNRNSVATLFLTSPLSIQTIYASLLPKFLWTSTPSQVHATKKNMPGETRRLHRQTWSSNPLRSHSGWVKIQESGIFDVCKMWILRWQVPYTTLPE